MDVEYSVTEHVHRNRSGHVVQVDYQFEELVVIETTPSLSTTITSITKMNTERRTRSYNSSVTREQYQDLTRQSLNPLSFDNFLIVLRPFLMGFYDSTQLEQAFQTLDRDHSGTIHINELCSFLPILNDAITTDALHNYIRKVDENFDGNINYDEFRALVLRGIGRDIICNHI
jgi:Ca2+-binding EF-hand superfamily protein